MHDDRQVALTLWANIYNTTGYALRNLDRLRLLHPSRMGRVSELAAIADMLEELANEIREEIASRGHR